MRRQTAERFWSCGEVAPLHWIEFIGVKSRLSILFTASATIASPGACSKKHGYKPNGRIGEAYDLVDVAIWKHEDGQLMVEHDVADGD
jgi:hypothetical protein